MSEKHPLLRSLAIYREMPWRFCLVAALYVAINLGLVWQQWLIGHAVNDVSAGHAVVRQADGSLDASLGWYWLGLMLAVALGRGVLQYAASVLSLVLSQELLTRLRERILDQVQNLHLGYHWQHGMGEMITRTTRDADKVRDALISFWRQVVETPLVVLATVGLLSWYHPLLGLVPLLLTVTGLWIFVRQTERLVSLDRAVGAAYDRVNQDLSEGIGGVRVIKSFALEQQRINGFSSQVAVFASLARQALAYSSSRIPLPQAVVAFGHVWILVYGAHLVAAGQLNIGELVTSLLIATTLVFRIEGIGRVMQTFADARASAERIWQLLDAPLAIGDGSASLPASPLGLRLEHVSVSAPGGGRDILQDCSLTLQPGEIVALVGATGTGKSLLASLLPRLTDVSAGRVLLGSAQDGWQDIRSLNLAQLRRRVHVVPQESFLFAGSLAANLRLSAPSATDEQLHAALRMAAADDVLQRLPQGLETPLGDRGVTLSGGQRQRLCLARALLGAPDILCLDDATSALDAISERLVLHNLRQLRGTTVLVISSKLSTILLADRVLMLEGGKIAAEGPHAQLQHTNAHYRDLLGIDHG
ncbi:ABC transporter ATP-binding protein [Pseudomonas sp. WS 5059]|uniref:ABC transporter ATP-binding protein n=1 Tax=unclassified Pseudomonas TaxID=196821 RepID=UPI00147282DA|nr:MULTISPECIES: ABC transporter ATP-binding protein [unclassified Pseudomonas]NMX60573.1 ABC transporter ATP-binding protein [Pseudomonas sp. WS 5079]NMX67019.1 ABC transporter ATP-binding protein [Pseudomonas sp. WS 5111]NMX85082.1 ABC transporter ATP-binding protein [Pseudomonas sp. WS 5010]NMY01690.1 ABC transporter ATP-binding protein [Pseudomonas sp. WS 5059]NMY25886.1 ABC transporter ATP-binding protein [Pseudomonas sp. WS 5021]